jgi:glutamyl-tRNA reductase
MSEHKAMLIGAGEMAELAATHLVNAGIKEICVVNRTYERAVTLAAQYKGLALPFNELFARLAEVDIVISSTGSTEPILRAKDMGELMHQRKNRPMFFIDIAVPRDIDPDVNALDNIFLYDIDDLKEVVEVNLSQRQEEAVKAQAIVEEEAEAFIHWNRSLCLQPTITDLISRTDKITQTEWERAIRHLSLDSETQKALQYMLSAIVKKYNHAPITFLKKRFVENSNDMEFIAQFRRMFKLDEE